MAAVYVGIDVAKAHLDRALLPATAEPWRDTNDPPRHPPGGGAAATAAGDADRPGSDGRV